MHSLLVTPTLCAIVIIFLLLPYSQNSRMHSTFSYFTYRQSSVFWSKQTKEKFILYYIDRQMFTVLFYVFQAKWIKNINILSRKAVFQRKWAAHPWLSRMVRIPEATKHLCYHDQASDISRIRKMNSRTGQYSFCSGEKKEICIGWELMCWALRSHTCLSVSFN